MATKLSILILQIESSLRFVDSLMFGTPYECQKIKIKIKENILCKKKKDMKAIVQRVTSASVRVDGEVISSIGKGLMVLVGLHRNDTRKELEYIAKKILSVRIFDDPVTGKRWNKSVKDLDLEVLCVSQFTLYHILKGNKVDFHLAMGGDAAKDMYEDLFKELCKNYSETKIKDGKFGAMMEVNIANDGPVTIELESLSTDDQNQTSSLS